MGEGHTVHERVLSSAEQWGIAGTETQVVESAGRCVGHKGRHAVCGGVGVCGGSVAWQVVGRQRQQRLSRQSNGVYGAGNIKGVGKGEVWW